MDEEGAWESFEFCGDEKLSGGSSFLPSSASEKDPLTLWMG
jgi:hypothetical protein